MLRLTPRSTLSDTLFPYATLVRSGDGGRTGALRGDLEAPTPVVLLTPAPAGSNDWQLRRPYVRLAGVDQATGSGVRHLSYSIDGGALEVYDEPLRIERGAHELCVTATDVAGNTSRPQCRIVTVDLDEPTVRSEEPTSELQSLMRISSAV